MKLYPKALNPDAFSKFIQFQLSRVQKKIPKFISIASQILTTKEKALLSEVQEAETLAMDDITEATQQLITVTIPTTAQRLIEMTERVYY